MQKVLRLFIVVMLVIPLRSTLMAIVTLENDSLKVVVLNTGCFHVTEKSNGHVWNPDPWEQAAGLLTLSNSESTHETVNISKCRNIDVKKANDNTIAITFADLVFSNGDTARDVVIGSEISLDPQKARLNIKITSCKSSYHELIELRYPARHFSLRTDVDKGAGVIPQWQGVICPSYIFPMTGGRFCQWDDAQYDNRSYGVLDFYNFVGGLSMPWIGTHTESSGVIGIFAKDPAARMEYIINNNGQFLFDKQGKMSPYPRILALTPVWNLQKKQAEHAIQYHFLPNGNHVQMAKCYRKIAKERGYFVSLREKAKKNPDVNNLPGAIYLGLYGGYPHYVNMPGMAFSFQQLKNIIQDVHDNLHVKNAFIHAWGTFSNYVPNNWPISEDLGGIDKLKEAVALAKNYSYLYSSYHAYSPRLEHDPTYNTDLLPRTKDGKLNIWGRWGRVDSKHFYDLCRKNLPKEIKAIGQNADVADILFIGTPDEGRIRLAKYLRSLNLVMGTERGQEHYIPYFDLFEGMTYYYSNLVGVPLSTISHKAPLFNLVYHDAIANYGKIQDPDNDITFNGDFRTKSLRNLLFGNGTLIFFAPYEYEGMREMIKMANKLVAPVHRETFYCELLDHQFLSDDFKVQKSLFSNGVEVTVNLGPVVQSLKNGVQIPGYGFIIKSKNGDLKTGSFKLQLDINQEFNNTNKLRENKNGGT